MEGNRGPIVYEDVVFEEFNSKTFMSMLNVSTLTSRSTSRDPISKSDIKGEEFVALVSSALDLARDIRNVAMGILHTLRSKLMAHDIVVSESHSWSDRKIVRDQAGNFPVFDQLVADSLNAMTGRKGRKYTEQYEQLLALLLCENYMFCWAVFDHMRRMTEALGKQMTAALADPSSCKTGQDGQQKVPIFRCSEMLQTIYRRFTSLKADTSKHIRTLRKSETEDEEFSFISRHCTRWDSFDFYTARGEHIDRLTDICWKCAATLELPFEPRRNWLRVHTVLISRRQVIDMLVMLFQVDWWKENLRQSLEGHPATAAFITTKTVYTWDKTPSVSKV